MTELEQALQSSTLDERIGSLTRIIESRTEEANQGYLALVHYHLAEAHYQQKQWDSVIAVVERLAELLPSDKSDHPIQMPDGSDGKKILAKSFFLLGEVCIEKKEAHRAVKAFSRAVTLNPDYWEAYFERAIAYELARFFRNAVYDYDAVLRLNPQFALAYYNRGTMHFKLLEHEQAAADYLEAVRLNPQDAYAHFNLGVVYRRLEFSRRGQNYLQKAVDSYSRSIELDPRNPEAYYNRGEIYLHKKEYDKKLALADFQKAAELGDPKAKNMLKKHFPAD